MPPAHRRQLRPTGAERPGLTKQKQDRKHLARRRIAARERQLTAGGGPVFLATVVGAQPRDDVFCGFSALTRVEI